MRKSKVDPHILDHLEWLGFVRPTGLVVSAAAMVRAGAILDRRDSEGQRLLREVVEDGRIKDFRRFAEAVLGWSFSPKGYAQGDDIPAELEVAVPDSGEVLRPDFAVRELEPKESASPWQLLVQVVQEADLDRSTGMHLSPQGRMERLLRQTGVSAGLIFNGATVRLVSAPRGESSGWLDFKVSEMVTTGGRPICAAMRMLLGQTRLLSLPKPKRLTALLDDSRKYQNEVSERLAEQVLHALYELLRGFQSAHDASKGELLREVLEDDPDIVYRSLLTVILRMVFLLYAEERDMLPGDETFLRYYSLAGLHERLREDAALNPDTMDQRFGAWAQLLVLFRMIYDGAEYGTTKIPKRHGDLFDPSRYPFLEGTPGEGRMNIPLVPDGTIYRALEKLLVLDGERLSYRALDVEQIGSVYETMMGFRIETATGRSVAIRAEKKHGAPTTIDLESLLAEPGAKRDKWLQDNAGRKLSDSVKKAVKEAATLEDLHAAMLKVIDRAATPDWVPAGSLILQPSEERRRSGSHYTPRSLTEPIVRTTLEPILKRLSEESPHASRPTPDAILDLKVCDPAMGSGAFLVEACRQLADALIESWRVHQVVPTIPPDEDEVVYARRLIAQRCLYGVDRNPMAVDLAKVSLWLVTLAKDHSFTFLDHALKHGDSLVGLDRVQVWNLHWEKTQQYIKTDKHLLDRIVQAGVLRQEIANAGDEDHDLLQEKLARSNQILADLKLLASAVVAAYFLSTDKKSRDLAHGQVVDWARALLAKGEHRTELELYAGKLLEGPHPLPPFHWEFEFPEVFLRTNGGFDAVVGNPPFIGGKKLKAAIGKAQAEWLLQRNPGANGNADLVAFFFRSSYKLLRRNGCFGLLATNSIAQGDTRRGGLKQILLQGGTVASATKRLKWPGDAAVVVSVVHVVKGQLASRPVLNGIAVDRISAFLFHKGGDADPHKLSANSDLCFIGSDIKGQGFLFDNTDPEANTYSDMNEVLALESHSERFIKPYIGGEEVYDDPAHHFRRWVIDFGKSSLVEAKKHPMLLKLVEEKVRGERIAKKSEVSDWPWWQFWRTRDDLYARIKHIPVVFVTNTGATPHLCFAGVHTDRVFAHSLAIVATGDLSRFCVLQSRPHEIWTRFFGSSLEDRLRYTPSDCFETFPFPPSWEADPKLEAVGKTYYEVRADLMVRNNEGLTKTYNRFHDPEERDMDILKLRELHAEMDRAVLDAYGWTDIPTDCQFILDYEEEEEDTTSRRKKPWRYRWPDDIRDEVLARLLELNQQRYEEEVRLGLHAKGASKKKAGRDTTEQGSLL